ncbi:MAG: FHA domain-containing protein [Planctomycetia bacterium]|nr:FHA domain-containing protein [Planctomycetia bacterium]
MASLYVIQGSDEGKRFELTTQVVGLGREANNTVRLHDTEASRRHSELRLLPNGTHQLLDLGSSNGTFVNGKMIKDVVLKPGDEIRIGQTTLVYLALSGNEETVTVEQPKNKSAEVDLVGKPADDVPSAIVKTVSDTAGARLLAKPTETAANPWLRNALANLSVMYQATQAVSHIVDNDQLLDRIMDLIFETIQADRGCFMLRHDNDRFEAKSIRFREGKEQREKITISKTIMDHVLKKGLGVLTSDAAHDKRFRAGPSVQEQGIREALCVPMKGRHETIGVLYLDVKANMADLAQQGEGTTRLTEDHLMLAAAIAHQAALALEDTRYYRAMMQSERLAAVGQTIAAISHHIKNILQGLKSGSDLLKLGINEDNRPLLLQGWKTLEKNQVRIYDLVMDMLSYSKEREPSLEETDLTTVANEVIDLLEGRARELNITIEKKYDPLLKPLQADAEGLHKALLNIVSNAVDALQETNDATITISTVLENNGRWAQLVVQDNGPGIPPEIQANIFKPFVSTKGSKGTGLGLAVSRKIMREHGGDVILHSSLGHGAKFIMRLPLPASDAAGQRRTMLIDESPAGA